MQYTIALLALAGTTFAIPQSSAPAPGEDPSDAYLQNICLPYNATGFPDFDAPCFALSAVMGECTYGPQYLNQLYATLGQGSDSRRRSLLKRQTSDDDGDMPMLSNTTQRDCLCESQFWDQATGCIDCFTAHGAGADYPTVFGGVSFSSVSSAYCAATYTPTVGISDYFDALDSSFSATATATATPSTSVFHDPIGNRTQVSLYYTARVTGTAALDVGLQGTGTSATLPTVNTVDGQIKATASQNNAAAPTPTTGAAMRTEAAIAGVVGVAGLLVLL